MVVYAETGIPRHPRADSLAKIYITGDFILLLVYEVLTIPFLCTFYELIPCFSAKVVPVYSGGQQVASEKLCILIPRDPHHIVTGVETVRQWAFSFARGIAVIDFMTSPVVEETQSPGSLFVMVLQSEGRHSPRDVLVGIQ